MVLDFEDVELFFKLQWTLMAFVNQRLRVISSDAASPEEYCAVAPELQVQVRDALTDNLFLIDAFVDENETTIKSWGSTNKPWKPDGTHNKCRQTCSGRG